MKKLLTLFAALMLCTVMAGAYDGYSASVKVVVNGHTISSDEDPFLLNGRTYAPIRFVYDSMFDCSITWNDATQTATVRSSKYTISLQASSNRMTVNGNTTTVYDGLILKNGRLFAPVRTIGESLDASVSWDSARSLATIGAPNSGFTPAPSYAAVSYSSDDLYWMSRIIQAEAGAEPMTGKIAVGNVIMNRVASADFPDTVYGVIFDKKYGTQFEPVINGTIYNTPSADSIEAAKRALSGERVVGNSLYFLNPVKAQSKWIINNRQYLQTIGSHAFYA